MELTMRTPLELRWTGGDFDGLVVVIRRMSIGEYLSPTLGTNLVHLLSRAVGGDTEARARIDEIGAVLADAVVEWSLPAPTTPAGVLTLDPLLVDEIIRQWVNRTVGVPGPLGTPSSGGEPFPEETLPMDVPSSPPPS